MVKQVFAPKVHLLNTVCVWREPAKRKTKLKKKKRQLEKKWAWEHSQLCALQKHKKCKK